jgi:steroid delta-isomerase-like uncharacterized protein
MAVLDSILNVSTGWTTGNLDLYLSSYGDGFQFEDVTFAKTCRTREELTAFFNGTLHAFSEFKVENGPMHYDDERGVMEWTMSGVHTGEWPGLPPTGKAFSVRGVSVCQFKDGKIHRQSDYWDLATLLRQIGVLPTA